MGTMVEYESQHLPNINKPHVGKYTSTMEHMGWYVIVNIC